jgi:hypothetical protein
MVMDHTFKPAGLMMTAIVAGLAPGAYAEAPTNQAGKHAVKQSPAAKEQTERETLMANAAKFKAAEPFAVSHRARETNVPLGGQMDLFD